MSEKILFVDDEPNVLDGYRRQLGKKYSLTFANGGEDGLVLVTTEGPFAVVVSDMNMDGIDGIRFLSKVHELAPDTVRIMLTGADHQTAVTAVNKGHVFRFLSKPCSTELLTLTLDAALAQYRLVTSERELLSSTLMGAVKILTDVLAAVRPVAFGRTDRVRDVVRRVGKELIPDRLWRAELAALLSQMGCVNIPEEVLLKAYAGKRLMPREAQAYDDHPRVGHDLVANVPRLRDVAQIILQQERRFDGSGVPGGGAAGNDLPIEARILKVALDFDSLVSARLSENDAVMEMGKREGFYDPVVIATLKKTVAIKMARSMISGGMA
jgi:response regulator RpfG family c-di-GMP phosphodiesterase